MSQSADVDADQQRAINAWSKKLSRSSVTLAPEVNAEVLAEEFGRLDENRRDEMCSSAVMIAFDDECNDVALEHFREAYEETEIEVSDNDDGQPAESDVSEATHQANSEDGSEPGTEPHTEPDQDAENAGGSPPEPEIHDENNDDVDRTVDGQSQDEDVSSQSDGNGERPEPTEMDRQSLEAEVAELRDRVDEVESIARDAQGLVKAVRRQMAQQAQLLVGEETVQGAGVDPENVVNHHQRLREMDERVQEQGDQIQMVRVDGGGSPDDPDSRARRIRQTLYNKAKQHSEGQAEMDRDDVDSRLGGGLHRDTVLDAMKRTADGIEAEREERPYTPINGSSDLQPVDSIIFSVGEGRGQASKVVMNLADATGAEIRQNLTTKDTEEDA